MCVASHPVGNKKLASLLKEIEIAVDATNSVHKTGVIDVQQVPTKLRITLNLNDILNYESVTDWKERFEFAYEILVDTAIHDVQNQHNAAEQAIAKYQLSVAYDFDRAFLQTSQFRNKHPYEQTQIVKALSGFIPVSISDENCGMVAIVKHNLGKDTCKSNFGKVLIIAEPRDNLVEEGVLSLNQSILSVQINLKDVVKASEIRNWKERILRVLNILEEISRQETNETKQSIIQELQTSLNSKQFAVNIDWSTFVNATAYTSLHPTKQVEIIKRINTDLLRRNLLGDESFTGPKGLCEFSETVAILNEKISSISIEVLV